MYEVVTYALPLAAAGLGIRFGRKASIVALIGCLLAALTLSFVLRNAVASSGEFGWRYYGEGAPADVGLTFGMGFFLAALALIGPSVFNRWPYALACSAALVIAFQLTSIPAMFALCALFAACV